MNIIKIRYSIESRIYVKGYGFLSFAKNICNKYGKKLFDTAKKSTTDAIKTAAKEQFKKLQKQQVT